MVHCLVPFFLEGVVFEKNIIQVEMVKKYLFKFQGLYKIDFSYSLSMDALLYFNETQNVNVNVNLLISSHRLMSTHPRWQGSEGPTKSDLKI